MKRLLLFVIIICSVAIGACSTTGVKLGVEYTWVPDNECSDVSPKIMVSGIPQWTEKLRISLTDRDVPSYNHGGGTVEYKGSNVIEAGALKYYSGPCPPGGEHFYAIKVDAIDTSGRVIGPGEKMKPCCRF